IAAPALAQTSANNLTGKMAPFNYVFGTPFNCTSNVPAMGGQPAHTENTTATFEAVSNNVLHVHIAGSEFVGDQYFGYSTQGNTYCSTSAASDGSASVETSADGTSYRGSMNMGPMSGTAQDVYSKTDNNHVSIRSSATIGGQTAATTISCSR